MQEKTLTLLNESDTQELAKQLALGIQQLFQSGQRDLRIALLGDLGAGKTTFTRYLLKALGHTGKVKSPTYALCEPYEIRINQYLIGLHHFDLYRMKYPTEWDDAGFRDTLSQPGISIIEWPQKAEGTLPEFDITLVFELIDEKKRHIHLTGHTSLGQELVTEISDS